MTVWSDERSKERRDAGGIGIALVACIAAAILPGNAAGAAISFRVTRDANEVVVEGTALLKSDAATAWRVLTDYESYPDFVPNVRSSRIVSRRGSEVLVVQSGDAALPPLRAPVTITYRIEEYPGSRIVSHASVGGLPALESVYELTSAPQGVRLDYRGCIATLVELAGGAEAGERSVARAFRALADRIEQASAANNGPDGGHPPATLGPSAFERGISAVEKHVADSLGPSCTRAP